MQENISYIEDEGEMARRKQLPPPVVTLPPPAHYMETLLGGRKT